MKWIKNLESIAITKTSGKCPHCGSNNTDYTFVGNVGGVGYGEIWCNDCKSAYLARYFASAQSRSSGSPWYADG